MPAEAAWYDRAGSKAEFLSLHVADMYLPRYLQELVHVEAPTKLAAAAVATLLVTAAGAYGPLFFVVCACWAGDMLFGLLRVGRESLLPPAQRRDRFRWSRAADGVLRLVVIVVIPGLLAMVGSVASDALRVLGVEVEMELVAGLATFGLAAMLVHEFLSVLDNASSLHPGMQRLRARLVTWAPGEGPPTSREVQVMIMEDRPGGRGGRGGHGDGEEGP